MDRVTKEDAVKILKQALIAFALVSMVIFFCQCIRNMNKFAEIDLTSYIRASTWFFSGDNPYQDVPRRYIYPLFLLLVVSPFQLLMSTPFLKAIAAGIWSLGSYLSFLLTLAVAWKQMYRYESLLDSLRQNIFPIALIVILIFPSLQDEFLNGQVNLYVMGATAAFFSFLEKDKPFLAALFLAIAASIKIAPALCLLYVLLTRQYRVALHFFILAFLLTLGIPYLMNPHSIEYYRYFLTDVVPSITGSKPESSFRAFSIISTLSYLFNIHWQALPKILSQCLLALALFSPIALYTRKSFENAGVFFRFTAFAAIVSIIPVTFPMSEAHHLLLQIIPCIVVVAYWNHVYESGRRFLRDPLSILFVLCAIGLQVGHAFKDTPIRLLSLIGLYLGLVLLLRRGGADLPRNFVEWASPQKSSPGFPV
jgi:hypothetical protein